MSIALLIQVLIVLLVAGAAYAIVRLAVRHLALPAVIESIAAIVIVVAVAVYLLQLLGLLSGASVEGLD